ncbi:hypothetical protein MMC10_009598 [Thelotrema lepadinum]|nr:hypothetical protein [Thelotrema lepadinum]
MCLLELRPSKIIWFEDLHHVLAEIIECDGHCVHDDRDSKLYASFWNNKQNEPNEYEWKGKDGQRPANGKAPIVKWIGWHNASDCFIYTEFRKLLKIRAQTNSEHWVELCKIRRGSLFVHANMLPQDMRDEVKRENEGGALNAWSKVMYGQDTVHQSG